MERPFEILLVEDNPGDIALTTRVLKNFKVPYRLTVVMDGIEAMTYLQKEGKYETASLPDLILLDLNLPKKDGRELLRELKESQFKQIPVVVLTTSNADTDIFQSYDLHANCFINKPVDFTTFEEVFAAIEAFWFRTVTLPPRG